MPTDTFMYFAYGSNMLFARLHERCPSAERLGVAKLADHELRWHKRSKDGSGKCDIGWREDSRVFGALYRIAGTDKHALDRAEGLGRGYEEISVQVTIEGENLTARTYQATDIDESLKPYSWYQALVVAGARECGIPENYVERLQLITSTEDPNRTRHDKQMGLVREASW